MTEYVLMNKRTGVFGLGIRLIVPFEVPDSRVTVHGEYGISIACGSDFVWAVTPGTDQPYVVVFDQKVMDDVEILGQL